MVGASMVLGILTITGTCTPTLLLIFTFLLGVGAVMNDPAWQALTPELVPATGLANAVALNSAGFNIARAAGPAIGGLVIAMAGSGTAFLLNAVSFFGVIMFLYRWKPAPHVPDKAKATIAGAISIGLRYVKQDKRIRAVLARTVAFSLFASAFWALLPLIARRFGAEGYGAMLAFFGLGALAGALLLAAARRHFSLDKITVVATLIFAVALCGLVRTSNLFVASAFAAAAGLAWISVLATLEPGGSNRLRFMDTSTRPLHVCFVSAGRHGAGQRVMGHGGVPHQRKIHTYLCCCRANPGTAASSVVSPARPAWSSDSRSKNLSRRTSL